MKLFYVIAMSDSGSVVYLEAETMRRASTLHLTRWTVHLFDAEVFSKESADEKLAEVKKIFHTAKVHSVQLIEET